MSNGLVFSWHWGWPQLWDQLEYKEPELQVDGWRRWGEGGKVMT